MAGSSKEMEKVLLRTADGGSFVVSRCVAAAMVAISCEVEAGEGEREGGILVPNVTRPVLAKILRFLHIHVEMAPSLYPITLERFDKEFLNVSVDFLYHILLAAYHLKIVSLRDLVCQKVADMMKGKSIDEIRTTFNIPNEYTAEEMAKITKKYPWIFDQQLDDEKGISVEKDKNIENEGTSKGKHKRTADELGSVEKDNHIENKKGTNREEEIHIESKEGASTGKDKQIEDKEEREGARRRRHSE
ncbi:SKP1-like protein 1A [Ananas comosus]|uniref:SKP1-like protein 1A n=1 Tax=Ananas comosus TaxID=4615 RepID=A0A199W9W8_ANACO|nr:SKP1-like protein 1A [Ananas comosus]